MTRRRSLTDDPPPTVEVTPELRQEVYPPEEIIAAARQDAKKLPKDVREALAVGSAKVQIRAFMDAASESIRNVYRYGPPTEFTEDMLELVLAIANNGGSVKDAETCLGLEYGTLYRWANEKQRDGTYTYPNLLAFLNLSKQLQESHLRQIGLANVNNSFFNTALYNAVYDRTVGPKAKDEEPKKEPKAASDVKRRLLQLLKPEEIATVTVARDTQPA